MDNGMDTNVSCYSCGEPISAARIVTINGQQYHEKCSTVIRCTSCRKVIGFLGRGEISSERSINCIDCAQPRQST